ncbi:MAG: putative acetyltransferase [Gemmatimonadetes bacterium]|nr:putative acetyltransferase [Gemmatimonadota bacterium]
MADAPALAEIGERTFRDTFQEFNRAEDMDAYVSTAYTLERIQQDLREAYVLVAERDGVIVGFGYLHDEEVPACVRAAFPEATRFAEVLRFYIAREMHGTGLANQLMDALFVEAASRHAEVAWLGVWESNRRAIRFYEKRGFLDVGGQKFALGEDLQDDRVMARAL